MLLVATASLLVAAPIASAAPTAPAGVTAIALDGKVEMAWQSVSGASSYTVYRGTSASSVSQAISPSGLSATQFTDSSAANGTTYFYAVTATGSAGGESSKSTVVSATPQARTCSSGNPTVLENCFPGTTNWKLQNATSAANGGIEGFATKNSINAGDSVDLKVNTAGEGVPYKIEIYRTGWYGGTQGRLISVITGLTSQYQGPCQGDGGTNTGLTDCSNWHTDYTLSSTSDWPSGVYLLRLVRTDNSSDDYILLTVRHDASHSQVVYQVPVSTYEAYNSYGKSLYSNTSSGPITVSGQTRAVQVSFDRPYMQAFAGLIRYDWYVRTDIEFVSWLEEEGYDTSYITSVDTQESGPSLTNHKAFIAGSHDEYWSTDMRNNVTAARDAGTSLFWAGGNSVFWKIRYIASPYSGQSDRVIVCYKTTQSGPDDPSGIPTGSWRDPNGANNPENTLLGEQYIGDNDSTYYPMQVNAAQGQNRVWRYTSLSNLAPGTTQSIGTTLVGWEWDATNAFESGPAPSGLQVVSGSSVNGEIYVGGSAAGDDGNGYILNQNATAQSTDYVAPSGAVVFATGANHWARGLGQNMQGQGEPNPIIMQATANVLADMGAQPATPTSGLVVDQAGAASVTGTSPASGATGVSTVNPITATFDRELDPATVDSSDFTLTDPSGNTVQANVAYNRGTHVISLTPVFQLDSSTTYTAHIGTAIKDWNGSKLAAPVSWSFTTGLAAPPAVASTSPSDGQTAVSTTTKITATFNRNVNPSTVNSNTFQVSGPSGAVQGQVTYDSSKWIATFTPNQPLANSTKYTATLTTGIAASDGQSMTSAANFSFTTRAVLGVATQTPSPFASGISPSTQVRATFSRALNAATVTSQNFTLSDSSGNAVAGSVIYDPVSGTATFAPASPLALGGLYTVSLTNGIQATDGEPLQATSWMFTVASSTPATPTVTKLTPADGTTFVQATASVTAQFSRGMDPATLNQQSFVLQDGAGNTVPTTVTYDPFTTSATLNPSAPLVSGTHYTAQLSTAARASDETPLAATVRWSFTAGDCPCSLFPGSLTPQITANPGSFELGVKLQVTSAQNLVAFRFYKDAAETGTHLATLWTTTGTVLAQATFQNETASGWQTQKLATPYALTPGTTYIVSVGVNSKYVASHSGLAKQIVVGPLQSVADGKNGVYASPAGTFPTSNYLTSNYFVDAVVKSATNQAPPPSVTAYSPVGGATGVNPRTPVKVAFSTDLTESSVNGSTFLLQGPGGANVNATVKYDSSTRTATLTPASALAVSSTYTVTLTTGITRTDGIPLAQNVTWQFGTASSVPPIVTSVSPASSATQVSTSQTVQATFSSAMNAATLNSTSFSLTTSGVRVPATVSYNGATQTATLTPSSPLQPGTTYTANITQAAQDTIGNPIAQSMTWSFTTSNCPCMLMSGLTPAMTGNPVQDGRKGTGPFSYEMGTKIQVSQPAQLTAIRFYKDASETGTHTGRLWSSTGTLLAQTTFTGESASGWQQQTLSTPFTLQPGQTYVVSVGLNAFFDVTKSALRTSISSGPLSTVADGANGVFASAAGSFPTLSSSSSNYFVDAVVQ